MAFREIIIVGHIQATNFYNFFLAGSYKANKHTIVFFSQIMYRVFLYLFLNSGFTVQTLQCCIRYHKLVQILRISFFNHFHPFNLAFLKRSLIKKITLLI